MPEDEAHAGEPPAAPPRVTAEAASAFIERRLKPQLAWCDGKSKRASALKAPRDAASDG